MRVRPVLFILSLFALSCKQKENSTKRNEPKKKVIDRLNERYYLIRTHFTFPKLGITVPANAYVLSSKIPGDSTTMPGVFFPAYNAHHISDDTLSVPDGTQCHFSLKNTALFFNAGSQLAFTDPEDASDFSGEVEIRTGPDEEFNIATGNWQIKVRPRSILNMMAYDNEPSVIMALKKGSATVNSDNAVGVVSTPDEALIIDKTSGRMTTHPYRYADAAAWTNGRLSGKELNLRDLFRQLERLYDTHFGGVGYDSVHGNYMIPYRELTLGDILGILQRTPGVCPDFRGDSIYMVKKE